MELVWVYDKSEAADFKLVSARTLLKLICVKLAKIIIHGWFKPELRG